MNLEAAPEYHHPYSPLGAVLSYLVPGLGQVWQGRIGKGLLFFVCLYSLFFYGMALGSWQNVYLPDTTKDNAKPWWLPHFANDVYNRLPFAGQFWIGIAAWPAVCQYLEFDSQAAAGPYLGTFERAPRTEEAINELQRDGNKTWDLGWVYTVIAGVLNVLVIYDAFAGPAFAEGELRQKLDEERLP